MHVPTTTVQWHSTSSRLPSYCIRHPRPGATSATPSPGPSDVRGFNLNFKLKLTRMHAWAAVLSFGPPPGPGQRSQTRSYRSQWTRILLLVP